MLKNKSYTRLKDEKILWLATLKSSNYPHLVPVWFVYVNNNLYISTESTSVKAINIHQHSNVAFALESGNNPLTGEGRANVFKRQEKLDIIEVFKKKYGLDFDSYPENDSIIEITDIKFILT